jgi:cellulose synthase/poly-beta-1,6-N-acetylglucosamine synthase-like glycosyltransferase
MAKRKKKTRVRARKRPLTKLHRRRNTKPEVSIIITSFRESHLPQALRAIEHQRLSSYEVLVVSPDPEAAQLVKAYQRQKKPYQYVVDPGHGKSAALNLTFPKAKGDILILTDGDVSVDHHALKEILKPFDNPRVGCVAGRVISINNKNSMLGYWSHLLADAGAHRIRKEGAKQGFLECSGYLFAFRNHLIKKIPTDVAEDSLIPYIFKQKGFDIAYAERSRVLVKNPTAFNDWLSQRKRTAKAHETLEKYVDTKNIPRVKTFSNEIQKGLLWSLHYPQTVKEFYWTLLLFLARSYMWFCVLYETKIGKKHYTDKWERIKTAR